MFAVVRVQLLYTALGVVLLTSATIAEGENKWVWSGRGRSFSGDGPAAYFPGEAARPLYR
jgi:hypothetical protein